MLGHSRFSARVEHISLDTMFNTGDKSGISAHPYYVILCIICQPKSCVTLAASN